LFFIFPRYPLAGAWNCLGGTAYVDDGHWLGGKRCGLDEDVRLVTFAAERVASDV
jgi:hypothetical protein